MVLDCYLLVQFPGCDLDAANEDGSADQLIDFFSLFEIHFVAGEDSTIDNERIIRWDIVDIED